MLLARFYDPCSGKIWLNTSEGRQNLRDIRLEALRRRVGIVFEDAFLFAGTVAENIAYGHPQATADDIRRAAAAAGASDFINALPKGFDSLLTERGYESFRRAEAANSAGAGAHYCTGRVNPRMILPQRLMLLRKRRLIPRWVAMLTKGICCW